MLYGNTPVCLAFHFTQVQNLKFTHLKIFLKSLFDIQFFHVFVIYILFISNYLKFVHGAIFCIMRK